MPGVDLPGPTWEPALQSVGLWFSMIHLLPPWFWETPRRARIQLCSECRRGCLCAVASGNTCESKLWDNTSSGAQTKATNPSFHGILVAIKNTFLQENSLVSGEVSSELKIRGFFHLLSHTDCWFGIRHVKPRLVNQAKLEPRDHLGARRWACETPQIPNLLQL